MWLIDANVYLRVLVRENEVQYFESLSLLEKVKRGEAKAAVCGLVLAEIVWVLDSLYKLTRSQVAEKVNGILLLPGMKIVDDYDYPWALAQYHLKKVKYIDACIASMPLVRSGQTMVVSYDQDFEKLECWWVKPGEV